MLDVRERPDSQARFTPEPCGTHKRADAGQSGLQGVGGHAQQQPPLAPKRSSVDEGRRQASTRRLVEGKPGGIVSSVARSIQRTLGREGPPPAVGNRAEGKKDDGEEEEELQVAGRRSSDSDAHQEGGAAKASSLDKGRRKTVYSGIKGEYSNKLPPIGNDGGRRSQSTEPASQPQWHPSPAQWAGPDRKSFDANLVARNHERPVYPISDPGALMVPGSRGRTRASIDSSGLRDGRAPVAFEMAPPRLQAGVSGTTSSNALAPTGGAGGFRQARKGVSDPRQQAAEFEETIERLFDLTPRGNASRGKPKRASEEVADETERDTRNESSEVQRPFKTKKSWPQPKAVLDMAVCQRMLGRAALGLGERLDRRVMLPPGHMEDLMREVLFERKLEAVFVSFALWGKWDPDAMVVAQKCNGMSHNKFMALCRAARLSEPHTFGAFREIFVRFSHREVLAFKKLLVAMPDISQICGQSISQCIQSVMGINTEGRICVHMD